MSDWLYQRRVLLDLALSSTANDSETEWRRFVEICTMLGDSTEGLCEVLCDYFAAISTVCRRIKQIDQEVLHAWDYLLNSFFPALPQGNDLHHLFPLFQCITHGQFDAIAEQPLTLVSTQVNTIHDGLVLATVARMFFCNALTTFDTAGATDIREFVRQVNTPHTNKSGTTPQNNQADIWTLAFTPDCPTCGRPTVLRYQRKGRTPGRAFWGCSRFPDCRGTLPLYRDASRYPQFQQDDTDDSDWFYEYMRDVQGPSWNE